MADQGNVTAILGGGGSYLRVITPVTTNGTTPLLINGVQQTEETFLPLSAKKELEKKNRHLERTGSPHLVMKIEVVGG
jgi:hypothetical protein